VARYRSPIQRAYDYGSSVKKNLTRWCHSQDAEYHLNLGIEQHLGEGCLDQRPMTLTGLGRSSFCGAGIGDGSESGYIEDAAATLSAISFPTMRPTFSSLQRSSAVKSGPAALRQEALRETCITPTTIFPL
jgi:hypothetical protein